MKEIKFRYHAFNKHFSEEHFETLTDEMLINRKIPSWILSDNCDVLDKLMFTGLRDKSGKEIYEGDCLAIDGKEYAVFYDDENACFFLHDSESFKNKLFSDVDKSKLTITGNIFNIKA